MPADRARAMRRGPSPAAGACAVALSALVAWRLAGTPAILLGAALLPALGYAALLLWLLGPRRPPTATLVLLFLWGAGAAALLAAAANDAAQAWLGAWQDAQRARALAPRLAAPAIEEAIKAAPLFALLRWRRAGLAGVRDGIAAGACIGLGFTLTENATYFLLAAVQGGEAGLWQSIYLRGVLGGLNHAVFTATAGAGLGWFAQHRSRAARLAPLLGLALAIAEHALWNAVAAGAIDTLVCNPVAPGGACRPPAPAASLFVIAPLLVAISIGPPLVGLAVAARLARRTDA